MKILFIGSSSLASTSSHRAAALTRLGHEVFANDPYDELYFNLKNKWMSIINYRSGYQFIQYFICNWLSTTIKKTSKPELIWIEGGELFGKSALALCKKIGVPVILFNHDDPTGLRDGNRFLTLRKALPLYDLVTAVRDVGKDELLKYCSGKVLKIWMTHDEVFHNPDFIKQPLSSEYISDVCFIGTWMRNEDRDIFLLKLIERGINIAIWGNRWQKSVYWNKLKPFWRGGNLSGKNYVMAINGAKICIGLLSKGNRDMHTTRSMEIPFAGGLLCAERTAEHLKLYSENEEAIFWADADECADKCIDLLANPYKSERIRLGGMRRVRENKVGNENVCQAIILAALPMLKKSK